MTDPRSWFACDADRVPARAGPAHAQFTATETNNVSIVYLEPTQTFIVPHVGRSFENALAFHQKLFDFKPREKIDGPAHRLLRRRQRVGRRGAARLRHAAHRADELRVRDVHRQRAHVVSDEPRARARDDDRSARAARPLLPRAVSRQGGARRRTSRVGGLSVPDRPAARGAALVPGRHRRLSRHLDGRRLGRAQGPYDEMVFRSMVLDGSRFYDPLGLVVGADQDRLPGGSQLVSVRHALHELPGLHLQARVADSLDVADDRLEGVLRLGVQAGLRDVARAGAGATGSPSSRRSSARTSTAIRDIPTTPYQGRVARGARLAVAGLRRPRTPDDLRRPELSGHRAYMAPSGSTTAASSICTTSSSRASIP